MTLAANVFDDRFTPGGSSCGSAVAVADGLCTFALGTDTAGSGALPQELNRSCLPLRGHAQQQHVKCRVECVNYCMLPGYHCAGRVPAGNNGIVGIKPSVGRFSTTGVPHFQLQLVDICITAASCNILRHAPVHGHEA